jgi:hypothetical protein
MEQGADEDPRAIREHGDATALAINRLLLYPENLTPHFFDLRSGEAGAIQQKLHTYHLSRHIFGQISVSRADGATS